MHISHTSSPCGNVHAYTHWALHSPCTDVRAIAFRSALCISQHSCIFRLRCLSEWKQVGLDLASTIIMLMTCHYHVQSEAKTYSKQCIKQHNNLHHTTSVGHNFQDNASNRILTSILLLETSKQQKPNLVPNSLYIQQSAFYGHYCQKLIQSPGSILL